jgi:hypothetical protein
VIGAVLLASHLHGQYQSIERERWNAVLHDRNAHYLLGVNLALHVREGDFVGLFRDLDRSRVWPPLHGVVLAGVLLIGGPDHRLAVLPSLMAWVGSVVLLFLITRRALPRAKILGGMLAVLLFLASPAHRAYALDVMLESLGTFLTLLVLYLYQCARQTKSNWLWRGLAVSLTLLFTQKYNYWALAVAAIVGTECWRAADLRRWRAVLVIVRDWLGDSLRRRLRDPLTYLLLGLLVLAGSVMLTGGFELTLVGRPVSIRSPRNLFYLAYVVVFVKGLLWLRRSGWSAARNWSAGTRQLLLWHGAPVALWFLWPSRIGPFLWYMGPTNAERTRLPDVAASLGRYLEALRLDYGLHLELSLAVLGLGLVGILLIRRLRPGTGALGVLVVLAALATILHPNQKARFLHTWLPVVWSLAAVAATLSLTPRWLDRWRSLASAPALTVLALVGWLIVPASMSPGRAYDQRPHGEQTSNLDLSDFWLEEVADGARPCFLATAPMRFFFEWTFLEARGRHAPYDIEIKGMTGDHVQDRRRFEEWLRKTPCDVLVFVDMPLGPFRFAEAIPYEPLREWLPEEDVLRLQSERFFPKHGCRVQVWRKGSAVSRHSPSTGGEPYFPINIPRMYCSSPS